jgi:hypothetical protein
MDDLGHILETIAFKAMSQKQLVERVYQDTYHAQLQGASRFPTRECVIRRVDQLAEKYGTLGITRRKLVELVMRRAKNARSRAWRNEWRKWRSKH